jgi:hypothetical protein
MNDISDTGFERPRFYELTRPYLRPETDLPPPTFFDVETDGIRANRVHCVVISHGGLIEEFGPDRIEAGLNRLGKAELIVGHNIAAFDLPILRRLYLWRPAEDRYIRDTLVMARQFLVHIRKLDVKANYLGDLPLDPVFVGRHSLAAWAARLGIPKPGADITDWSTWTPEIQARCVGDVKIVERLWKFFQPDEQE